MTSKNKIKRVTQTELCRLALKLYEENVDESKKDILKKNLQYAYEAVPKEQRGFVLGDMDLHDGPIRDIVYGEQNIINWNYKQYITENGELYLPHFCESHKDIFTEAVDFIKENGAITIPQIIKYFKVSYARAAKLLKELKQNKVV